MRPATFGGKSLTWAAAARSSALACVAAMAALSAGTGAHAAVVFNNGSPDLVSGVNMNANAVAEDFTLAASTTLTNIRFFSLMGTPADYSGTIGWRILGDAGGSPGAALASGSVSPALTATGGVTGFGAEEYVFDIALSQALTAGTYWLELSGLALDPVDPSDMMWSTTGTGQGAQAKYFDTDLSQWFSAAQNLAFVLDGSIDTPPPPPPPGVPEPTPLALAMLGLALAGALRRKA